MTREELTDWWRLYVRTLAGLLEAAEGTPGVQPPPNVLQQVQQLQREALFLHIRCARVLARALPAALCSVHGPQCCPARFRAWAWAQLERSCTWAPSCAGVAALQGCLAGGCMGREGRMCHCAAVCRWAPRRCAAQGGGHQCDQREALCGERRGGPLRQRVGGALHARGLVAGARS